MTTALVTGADSGIGREFARQLAHKGHAIVLVARDRERLDSVAADLRRDFEVETEVVVADLSDRAQVDRVAARLADAVRPVDVLVNDAGFAINQGFLDSDLQLQCDMLDVLCTAVLVLSHAGGRAMRSRGRGTIINVSSVSAYEARNSYSAAKAWVRVFSLGLARELSGTGVRCTAVCPGFTHTELHAREGRDMSWLPKQAWLEPEQVVTAALSDAAKGKVVCVPTAQGKVVAAVMGVVPRGLVGNLSRRRRARAMKPATHAA